MEMPAAEQRKRDAWIGSDSVTEERGLKMGGWYAMIMDAGSESASSATRVVRLVSMRAGQSGRCVCVFVIGRQTAMVRAYSLNRQQDILRWTLLL